MGYKSRRIVEEYRTTKEDYIQLRTVVLDELKQKLEENRVPLLSIENRIKTEESLAEKVERKGDKYH